MFPHPLSFAKRLSQAPTKTDHVKTDLTFGNHISCIESPIAGGVLEEACLRACRISIESIRNLIDGIKVEIFQANLRRGRLGLLKIFEMAVEIFMKGKVD